MCYVQANSGPLTISLDGNFGLCRKKAAGASIHDPLSQGSMFLKQSSVDQFVANYKYTTTVQVSIISLLSRNTVYCFLHYRNAVIFLLGIPFGQAQGMLVWTRPVSWVLHVDTSILCASLTFDMEKGVWITADNVNGMSSSETLFSCRISYSVYLLTQLRHKFPDHHIQLMYDVACTLRKHLEVCYFLLINCNSIIFIMHIQSTGQRDLLERTDFAVPIFHAYGHKLDCQVL